MPHPVLESAARFRAQLLAQERQAATRLVEAYGTAYRSLQTEYEALEEQVAGWLPERRDAETIRRMAVLRSLQRQVAAQVEAYAQVADREIAAGVSRSIELGLRGSLATVQAYWPDAAGQAMIGARWDMLPSESVETMLGFTAADSPLRQTLVGRLGAEVATRVGDALVNAIATGQNPRATADLFRRELGLGLTWSLNTARTAQIWAYRDATRLNYMNNRDVVSGWKWQAALDDRTCLSCWAQHGTTHGVDEILNDHHSGRCVPIPIVPLAVQMGLSEPVLEPGADQFARLPEATQRSMMGPAMFEAWQAGEFKFADLTRPYSEPVYGDMLRQATLTDLLGEPIARKYIDMTRVSARSFEQG
jgi:hypothetical protein